DVSRMKALLERYPNSIWADNAQFEIARYWRRQPAVPPWLVMSYRAGERAPTQRWVREDVARASQEFQKLVDRYPDSPFAPLALSQRALIGLNMLDFDLSRTSYERLVAYYPRAPEAHDAGIRLSAAYRREGDFQKALRAADAAAEVAAWDLQGEALLAAARAAQRLGREDLSRDRYRRARAAALLAVERATKGHKSPSRLLKGELFDRSNAVMQACEDAMSGNAAAPPPQPAATEVVGRIVKDGRGLPGVRVALGVSAAGNGLPSPFREGPAVSATTDDEGAFQLNPVLAGQYRVAAFAMPAQQEELECFVENLRLPVAVNGSPIVLPTFDLQCEQREKVEPVARGGSPTSRQRAPQGGEPRRSRSDTTRRGGRGRR
ncbi:MAG: tetratricopeptide repeat protein, partial [Armatimonadota bacterium]|nr:tetratricopeptide repeat protein [Armatimonadota bacterium]